MSIAKVFAICLILSLPFSAILHAEWFDGEVQKTDAQARTITISEIDPITETEEKEEILVDNATIFSGVASLQEIRKNDDVTIEAQYDESSDVWRAISVEVAEAGG